MTATVGWPSAVVPQPQWCSWLDVGVAPACPRHRDAFRLDVVDGVVTVDAGGLPGATYARSLLGQLERCLPGGVPDITVVDWPDLDVRGVTLDCSRGRVPTVETLAAWIEHFATLRLNHVELYLEATLQHPGHDEVWRDRSAYSYADIAALRDVARRHHIELTGQQNALGHLEHWLACERYAHLAALPGGYVTPDGSGHEPPATVEPTNPEAFALVGELVTNTVEAFDALRVHVGLDEPIDLNPAVWDAIFDVPGAPVPWSHVDNGSFCVPLPPDRLAHYVDWVRRLRALPALAGRTMLMWGDVCAAHRDAIAAIPDDVVIVEWGYEADHAFDARCGRLRVAGRTCWVAPGTSGWSAIGARVATMRANVDAALDAAARHGASGLLMTSWGTNPSVSDWPGFVWAAAGAWNRHRRPDLGAALDLAVVGTPDAGLGPVWSILGTVSDRITPRIPEASSVSEMFRSGGMAGIGLALGGMTPAELDAVDADLADAAERLAVASVGPWREELEWVLRALRWGSAAARLRLGWEGARDADGLRAEHAALCAEHERLWFCQNRVGGYEHVRRELAATLGGL